MKILELFAGTRSIGKVFEAAGHEVYSVEWDKKHENIDWYEDISKIQAKDILEKFGKPDVIWASPDCSSYSVAAISHHRIREPDGNLKAKTDYAKFCDSTNEHVVNLIKELNPHLYFIENPRGGLRKMRFMQDLPRYTVTYCFSGETEVITSEGVKTLQSLSGSTPELLDGDGNFVKSPVRQYGVQPLMKVTLSRAGKQKVIYATENHRWFVANRKVQNCETANLKKGDRLEYVQRAVSQEYDLINDWVARGFAFGDGWNVNGKSPQRKGHVMFCGEKQEMEAYFSGYKIKQNPYLEGDVRTLYGTPLAYKSLPSLLESRDCLFSWLAGYLAADGSVCNGSAQVTISSAKKEHLDFVRMVCLHLGIGTYGINEYRRKGYGKVETSLYQVTLMRSDVPESLLLREKHRNAFLSKGIPAHQARKWTVVSVESTNRFEPVFCAEVSTTHSFSLADGILTHNCQYGETRMKPTDLWTNHPEPKFKPPCKNGDPCHEAAPRGSRTGTQKLKGSVERSRIPEELCKHVLKISEEYVNEQNKSLS